GTLLQHGLELSVADQQQLDVVASAPLQLNCGIKDRIQPVGHTMGTSKNCHQIRVSNAFWPPWLHFATEDIQIAAVGNHGDSLGRYATLCNTFHDAGRQPDETMGRTIASPFENSHSPENCRVGNYSHGLG